jgi:hypothetical protein
MRGVYETNSKCYAEGADTLVFPVPEDLQLPAFGTIELTFNSIFTAPRTTEATDPFEVIVYRKDGSTATTDSLTGFRLMGLEKAQIQSLSISQVNSEMVANPTAVFFSITTLNPITSGGGVQVFLPKWNTKAPFALQESYLIEEDEF